MGSAMPDVTDGADAAPVFEVEFVIEDSSYPFVGASEAEACRFELAEIVPGARTHSCCSSVPPFWIRGLMTERSQTRATWNSATSAVR